MKSNKKIIFDFIFVLIFIPFFWYHYYIFETKAYVLTPSEYNITKVYSYVPKGGIHYRVNITYEKDGQKYTSRCFVSKYEFNIIKKYFYNISKDDAKNYLGNIKVYKNMPFIILKNEKINT